MTSKHLPVLFLSFALLARAEEYEIGGAIEGPKLVPFPTQHGELPGYPGWLPKTATDDEEESGARPGGLQPQFQIYPGSVENARFYWNKYVPVRSMFDGGSLLKKWTAAELPGKQEEYAAPLYRVPRHKPPQNTGLFNTPVPVVRAMPGAVMELDLGELPVGLYAVRVVGAVETKHLDPQRKPLFVSLKINDETYRLRVGYVDEFYSVAEFYFHATEKRRFKAAVGVDADSTVPLLVQCVDLHDCLTGIVQRPIKKATTLTDKKPAQTTPIINMAERLAGDAVIWGAMPPLNAQFGGVYGPQRGYDPSVVFGANGQTMDQLNAQFGKWELPRTRRYDTSPNPVLLVNTNLNLQYTIADLAAHKPLPDPFPVKDTGASVVTPGSPQQNFTVIADACVERINQFYSDMNKNAEEYAKTGNGEAGWKAAMELCRIAWQYPTLDGMQSLGAVVNETGGFGQDRCRRRSPAIGIGRVDGAGVGFLLRSYDKLFDVIKDNAEFAKSLGRFIPWVKTPADVIKLLDVYLVQYEAKRVLRYNYLYDNEPCWIVEPATVLGDRSVTDPWLAWLFEKAYIYPNSPTGLGDIILSGNDRDGIGYIGSWTYALGEQAGINARKLEHYIRAGGNPRYDLTDPRRYPNVTAVPDFMIDCYMAGLHFPRVGDVCGPDKAYGAQLDATLKFAEDGWRWKKDAKFAYILKHYLGRTEPEIEQAAATVNRAPWFDNRSRVLINWFGVLETGLEHDDPRFRRSAMLRIGAGYGHAHADTLDLEITAHGLPMTTDAGQRVGYGKPGDGMTRLHNAVEVDGKDFQGHSWIRAMTDGPGAKYMLAEAIPGRRRQVALIDVDEGVGSQKLTPEQFHPKAKLPAGVTTPNSYVVDVSRTTGGKLHTYCFHAALEDELVTNIENQKPYEQLSSNQQAYVSVFRNQPIDKYPMQPLRYGGTAPDHLEATWRMATTIPGTGLGESEFTANYDPQSPRKYTKLHLFGHKGADVMTGWYWCRQWSYGFNNLYIQQATGRSIFPAIIEPYAGSPFIESCRLVEGATLEVKTKNGHTDLIRMGEDEFSYVSRDKDGLRLANISAGTALETPEVKLKLAAHRTGKVVKVNYAEKQMTIEGDKDWTPGVIEVGQTTHTITQVAGNTFTLAGGAAVYSSRILRVDAAKQEVACKLGLPPVANGVLAGLDKDLVVSNEAGTKFWRAEYKGPAGGGSEYVFKLDAPFTEPVGSGLRVWDYGVGDTVRQATFANLRRTGPKTYELTGNTPVTLNTKTFSTFPAQVEVGK